MNTKCSTKIEEIKRLYYRATPKTIDRDVDRAIDILKSMAGEAERERAAVYMDGLAQMRSEWRRKRAAGKGNSTTGGATRRRP